MRGNFTSFISKSFKISDHLFPLLFPNDSASLKFLDIQLHEVGATRCLTVPKKLTDGQTHGQRDGQTDMRTYRKHRPRRLMLSKSTNIQMLAYVL